MALLTRNNLIYFGAALIVGACLAFGIASITYEPVPLQVKENPYQPLAPPAPAVTVLPPQFIPGSMAAAVNTTDDPYAPAPAPVIVTTAPLPTITPAPAATSVKCIPNAWNHTQQQVQGQTYGMLGLAGILPIVIISVGILMIIAGALGPNVPTSSLNASMNTMSAEASSAFGAVGIGGCISMIVWVGGVLLALCIISVVLGIISHAVIIGGC